MNEQENTNSNFKVDIQLPGSAAKIVSLNRINIILGANGSGKSTLLNTIMGILPGQLPHRTVVYIEGGRAILLEDSLELSRANFNDYKDLPTAEKLHRSKRLNKLSTRVKDAMIVLDKKGQQIKEDHSDEVENWRVNGKQGDTPVRGETPLLVLFQLFNEIFPSIELHLDVTTKQLRATKNGGKAYSINALSDGEKQVLSILADIALVTEPQCLLFIDEPELNLNPLLASKVWETIEASLPESLFVYATHDVGFCLRESVDVIYVLNNENEDIFKVESVGDIHANEMRALLGNISAILSANRALITEGQTSSFDPIFYKWITSMPHVEIVPMGGSSDVVAVANRQGVWNVLAPTVKIIGVIDRDYKSENFIAQLESGASIALKYHEAESYLCLPDLVVDLATKLGIAATAPTTTQVEEIIVRKFQNDFLNIIAKRVFEKTHLKLSISIERGVLRSVTDQETLKKSILNAAAEQRAIAAATLDDAKIEEYIAAETEACQNALASKNIEQILQLVPGKSLLSEVVKCTGLQDQHAYLRACVKHIQIDQHAHLKELRDKLAAIT